MRGSVIIDCFPESAQRYRDKYAIVVIDVIRATTTATTAVSLGIRVLPVRTTDEAFVLASTIENPLLVGELGGNMPYGFDMTNSPAQIAMLSDTHRPIILLSSSGTQLLLNSTGSNPVYIACFRNISAMVQYLSGKYEKVALLGAGTRGQFRREDQMGCAWIAEKLIESGYQAENTQTEEYISRWHMVSPEEVRYGRSAEYLRKSSQDHDLEYILQHIDDLKTVPSLVKGELVEITQAAGNEILHRV
jgi:2-phosphosulfolactate phosphatase